ncbi:efhand domain-containing protein/EF_hand_5 domain-containing protein [Cephalotus follicularis]|uniref:Efhand domain-containing protein/EF_hand_5 domain-containing protein n=1 Tax=Cephalotus follicularis TaxID=3775 RepID=A0A1Q3CYI9_CEPFO|nr:efhand domain-containing protein/EF_hand_5 domain-containing protein [Cephalotus follicularis]
MSPLYTDDLQRIFEKLDKNGDGLVSLDELNWLLERTGMGMISQEEFQSFVGKPNLNLKEFLLFCNNTHYKKISEEDAEIVEAFKVFDMNGDGFISCEELQSVLSRLGLWDQSSGNDCKKMICVYDTNLDGVLDFEEFRNMMFKKN